MNWYLQSGKESDVVVSSRIRLARNIIEYPFETRCSKKENEEIVNKIKEVLPSIGYGLKILKLKDMDDITKMSLVEKRLVSPDFVMNKNDIGAIAINEEENICIMINEEDHLRLQVFAPGFEIEELLKLMVEIDTKFGKALNYAYNDKYGYLTACPTNVGTGMRVSVMVHLPALTITKNINKVFYTINNFGVNIVGAYGENSKELGDIFQISNKRTLGVTEKEIIENIKVVTEKLIEQERKARKFLAKDTIDLEDTIYRSYGVLNNCRKISLEEAQKLISNVKMGTDLGVLPELNDSKVQKLILYTKPANMQKYLGEQYETLERDIKRAEVIKKIMSE